MRTRSRTSIGIWTLLFFPSAGGGACFTYAVWLCFLCGRDEGWDVYSTWFCSSSFSFLSFVLDPCAAHARACLHSLCGVGGAAQRRCYHPRSALWYWPYGRTGLKRRRQMRVCDAVTFVGRSCGRRPLKIARFVLLAAPKGNARGHPLPSSETGRD